MPSRQPVLPSVSAPGVAYVPTAANRNLGLWLGLLAVVAFSGTLPATRLAVTWLDPVFVGLGRALVAAVLAAIVLAATRTPIPRRALWPRLGVVALGVVAGWPVLTAFAMRHVPASHGAVVAGLLPLATALAGAWLAHERPRRRFWIWAGVGSAVVMVFALWEGGGALQPADLLLAGAVAAAAIGYAEGARLARILGGWQVICWVLILAAPFVVIPTWLTFDSRSLAAPWQAWAAFAYVAVISQFLGFFVWYRGLAVGGIAAVGQTQLLQPFLTIFASAWLLAEPVTTATYISAGLVIAAIAMGRRA